MKKIAVLFLAIMMPLILSAQNADFDSMLSKYGGKEGFTTINLDDPGQIFGDEKTDDDSDLINTVKEVKSVKILAYDASEHGVSKLGIEFADELRKLGNSTTGFQEFMSVNSNDDYVRMVYKKADNKVSEFLIIAIDSNKESVLIRVNGSMDFNNLGKIGKAIKHIKGK